MTVQEIALDLLAYAGVYGFTLAPATTPTTSEDEAEIVRAVAAMNNALQVLYADGPIQLKFDTRSSLLNPPTQVTITVTQNTEAAQITAGWASWMRGCSIVIPGDQFTNRIQDATNIVGATASITLLRNFVGATGTIIATVYGDAALLDPDVAGVVMPVEIPPDLILRPSIGKMDFLASTFFNHRYWPPRYMTQYVSFFTQWEKTFGIPQSWRVERIIDSASGSRAVGSIYISINPIPNAGQAQNLTYDVIRKPIQVTRAGLAEDGADDPGSSVTALPAEMIESYMLPIARWKYVSSHPAIKNPEVRKSLKIDYDEVLARLRNGQPQNVQIAPVRVKYL